MTEMSRQDRCWVVAGLTVAGWTAEAIADKMFCSLRLIRHIRADDLTAACVYLHTETSSFDAELSLARSELSAMTVAHRESEAELVRVRRQRDKLIDEKIVGCKLCGRCGTPMDRYNTYTHARSGKEFCRVCHRRRQQRYRDEAKLGKAESGPAEIVLESAVTHRSA